MSCHWGPFCCSYSDKYQNIYRNIKVRISIIITPPQYKHLIRKNIIWNSPTLQPKNCIEHKHHNDVCICCWAGTVRHATVILGYALHHLTYTVLRFCWWEGIKTVTSHIQITVSKYTICKYVLNQTNAYQVVDYAISCVWWLRICL